MLRYKKANVTKACETLTGVTEETELKIDSEEICKWKGHGQPTNTSHYNSGQSDRVHPDSICLEREAKELMKQMKVSNENYPQAVELLQKKYNNPEKIIRQLTDKLQEDTAKNNLIEEQRRVLDTTAITVKQLQDLGENLDCQLIKSKMIKKFNNHIKKEVYKKKLDIPRNEWTTSKILIVLESVVSREEELQTTWKKNQQKEFPEEKDTDKSTKAKLKRQDRPLKCLYCKREGHRARECRTFCNPQQRNEILTKENRCYICTVLDTKPQNARDRFATTLKASTTVLSAQSLQQ
uniref:CCHC-type domain-containing protein n=1 Tax=Caenorhabditis japonica TaxID=281687 RepID=A0A8R1IC24_CAEJA